MRPAVANTCGLPSTRSPYDAPKATSGTPASPSLQACRRWRRPFPELAQLAVALQRAGRVAPDHAALGVAARVAAPACVLVERVEGALARAVAQHARAALAGVKRARGDDPVAQHLLFVAGKHAEHLRALA